MTNLTNNQQNLISRITEEFMRQNEVSAPIKSLLGIEEIVNNVRDKENEIKRVKQYNEIVAEEMQVILYENVSAIRDEIKALRLGACMVNSNWIQRVDGSLVNTIKIEGIKYSDTIYVDVYIGGESARINNEYLPNFLVELTPVILYNKMTFESFCLDQKFRDSIKKLYQFNK